MFDVFMYLFEIYIYSEVEMCVDQDKLMWDFIDVGFEWEDIYNVLMWFEKLVDYQEGFVEFMQFVFDLFFFWVYIEEECQCLDVSCWGFLFFFEQIQVLNFEM